MFDSTQAAFLDLRNIAAERTDRLVAWIGSGLSVPAGLPSWVQLRDALLKELEAKAALTTHRTSPDDVRKRLGAIRRQTDLWVAFAMLQKSLGDTTYRATIRRELGAAAKCDLPKAYTLLWRLPLAGVVNLNLDGLATRAAREVFRGRQVYEFSGTQAGDWAHVIKSPYPFILNLHGFHADASSWVLTSQERSRLRSDEACTALVDACLVGRTVIFAGVTADDKAVGSYLDSLRKRGVDFGTHFWFTADADAKADAWAERAGVRIIHYAPDNSHAELIDALQAILDFLPPEEAVQTPVVMQACTQEGGPLPSPDEVERMTPEDARIALNAHACRLLNDHEPDAYARYERFCRDYGLAIHKAWYVFPPHNTLFGYTLGKRIGGGAFGTVFEATSPDGRRVAIKLLREELRESPAMFQSFRRGVRSMRILSTREVRGIVPYEDASEIPAAVIMERVDGPNLQEAVERGGLRDWAVLLRFACDLASVIRSAHLLPERVLHRDIRPPNIMLRGFRDNTDAGEVLALDFDLSWHLGARELSVLDVPSLSGYLAPEQLERIPLASTRNALVDSFGFGMTLYFARSQRHPHSLEHRYADWDTRVTQELTSWRCETWSSLPRRFARLVLHCTCEAQAERWDMSQILQELMRLRIALRTPTAVASAELWAEELASRACAHFGQDPYLWMEGEFTAAMTLPRGVHIEIAGEEQTRSVRLRIHWMGRDGQAPAGIVKYLPSKCEAAEGSLRKHGWRIQRLHQATLYHAGFEAVVTVAELAKDAARAVDGVCEAADRLSFGPHEA